MHVLSTTFHFNKQIRDEKKIKQASSNKHLTIEINKILYAFNITIFYYNVNKMSSIFFNMFLI